ncbi:MAG: DUF3089 domain-containing protein [Imperialibacter sp.]
MHPNIVPVIVGLLLLLGFALSAQDHPLAPYMAAPAPPDYSNAAAWVALPGRPDPCDIYPRGFKGEKKPDDVHDVDVFFVYPTMLMKGPDWNADITDEKVNNDIRQLTIRFQASVFNGLGNIYSPYYRQMNFYGYRVKTEEETEAAQIAFDTAYADVKNAFLYYVEHFNQGKPFVLAAHSQGTTHSERLLKEVILPDEALSAKLQLAYLVGMPVAKNMGNLPPCQDPDDGHCFLSWRTYGYDTLPKTYGDSLASINPISFTTTSTLSPKKEHKGVLYQNGKIKFRKTLRVVSAQGVVQIKHFSLPMRIFGFDNWGNYHRADYNLFWVNIRENLAHRLALLR